MRLPDLPRLVRLPDATTAFGWSRSTCYRLQKEGKIRMVKVGAATFVVTESALALIEALPTVTSAAA